MKFTKVLYILFTITSLMIFLISHPALSQTCIDGDGDGYGINGDPSCPGTGVDCDDNDNTVYPGALKICDGKDNNCDGKRDFTTDEDKDGDGVPWCAGDCDDNDSDRAPNIIEAPIGSPICEDGIDNDCDNRIDSVDPGCQVACIDGDGDGYGVNGDASCNFPGEADCDDSDTNTFPGGNDVNCNGLDEDCVDGPDSGYISDDACGIGECRTNNTPSSCVDGVEALCIPGTPVFEGPQGDATCMGGMDEDCDTLIDGNDPGCQVLCIDQDGDGYGVNGDASCGVPGQIDCDDSNAAAHPGGDDANCNGIDEDCVGGVDNGYVVDTTCGTGECNTNNSPSSCTGGAETVCQPGASAAEDTPGVGVCTDGVDNDCDGLTDTADIAGCSSLDSDEDGDGFTENQGDCDDANQNVYPGAPKICDGKDSNCDGKKDFTTDEDKDGDGVLWCENDCDDNNPLAYPGNTEGPFGDATCSDGIDNDCQSGADAADPSCAAASCETKINPKDGPHVETMMDPGPDGLPNTSDDIVNPENSSLLCGKCHGATLQDPIRYACERCHSEGGVSKAVYPDPWPFGFGSAPDVQMHSSTVVGTKYGAWDLECVTCHNPHLQEQNAAYGTSYGKLIKEYICLDNPVTGLNIEEIIEFTAPSGQGSFADGPPHTENICNMCHTQTNHHQRDGTAPGGQDHNNGLNCTQCHPHIDGFKPTGGIPEPPHNSDEFINNCDYCHVTDGLGGIDFAAVIPDAKCEQCHTPGGALAGSFPTAPIVVTHADFNGSGKYVYNNACVECHNPMFEEPNIKLIRGMISKSIVPGSMISFTTLVGDGSFADGPPFNENICETCHSNTNHHQSDGTAPGGQDHNNGTTCTGCHPHEDGFLPTGGEPQSPHNTAFFISNCELCHVETDQGIDFQAVIPDEFCQRCHGARDSHTSDPARNEFASGNYTYNIMCVDCHNPMFPVGNNNRKLLRSNNAVSVIPGSSITNTTRSGPGSLADGPPHAENVCETCHSLTTHNRYDGTGGIHLDGIDKTGTYCMLCHDHNRSFMVPGPSAEEN